MREFLAALANLTICPVGSFFPAEAELRRSVRWYPAVGVLLAAVLSPIALLLVRFCPLAVTAVLLALLPEITTKCFHLDGLADTADAFFSSRNRERKLEIMKDSRLGTMGAVALIALLGLKCAAVLSMPADRIVPIFAASLIGGRCAMVWYIAVSRYAKPEGLGRIIFEERPTPGVIGAFFVWGAVCFGLFGPPGTIPALMIPFFALFWSWTTQKVIGGATGDTIGAAEELSELAVLLIGIFLGIPY